MLKLKDVEPQIATGDVLLFRGTSLYARLIKLRTESQFSHAGVVYRMKINGHTRLCVFEALEPGGVRLYPLDMYVDAGEDIHWYQLNDLTIDREKVADFVQRQWGKRYAMKQIWWSFSRLAGLLRYLFRWKLTEAEKNQFFCSELVAAALAYAGYKTDDGLLPMTTSPGDLVLYPCLQRKGQLGP